MFGYDSKTVKKPSLHSTFLKVTFFGINQSKVSSNGAERSKKKGIQIYPGSGKKPWDRESTTKPSGQEYARYTAWSSTIIPSCVM